MGPKERPGVTRSKILKILIREADLDGVVIITGREIGKELDLHPANVSEHIQNLFNNGEIVSMHRGAGRCGSGNVIQLAERLY